MNKQEIEEHIKETTEKLKNQKALVASLETQELDVAAQGDAKKVVATKKELAAARELLDGYELVLKSYQKKANELKEKREPEALKIRQRLAGELWPNALLLYDQVKGIQAELGPVLEKITQLNNEMLTLTSQHERLIGESILTPQIPVPPEMTLAANAKLGVLPKSLDVRLTTEREEQRLADLLKEQQRPVTKILERAGEQWPKCPTCERPMLAHRRGPDLAAYGMNEDSSRGYVNFCCPKHPEQTRDVAFPARPLSPGQRIIEGPAPLQSAFAVLPRNDGHGLARPGLTDQHKGGERK